MANPISQALGKVLQNLRDTRRACHVHLHGELLRSGYPIVRLELRRRGIRYRHPVTHSFTATGNYVVVLTAAGTEGSASSHKTVKCAVKRGVLRCS